MKMFQRDKRDVRFLKKLRMTLLGLQAVLSDAANKQASNPYVSQWLSELRDAVDGAENLIEEVNYEVLRLKVEDQHQNLVEAISNLQVTDLYLGLSDEFFLNIKKKLEDNIETLEELQKQIGFLDLTKYLDSGKEEKRESSTSVVVESEIFGRKNEIEALVGRLISDDANSKNLTVIPIVGMAGIGKTTLAKAVYNDEKVKKHFGLKAWICVSEPYDVLRITKELLQEFGLMVDNNLNQLQVKLKEILKGKKFLIVLDDVWNDNYKEWDDLRNIFVQGDIGSKIIVTTCKGSVASMMDDEKISMDILSSEVSWSLFKRHAFETIDPKEHPELEVIGKEIATKCNGLPLALKTLAGMLRSKSEVEGWKRILRSEIWELPNNDILAALKLSYNDLPAHLKQCFSYCAIFPKGYPFQKEQVIRLWNANGLVHGLQKDETIEDLGNLYFLELRSRSLFERVSKSSQGNTEKFLMHDLVNDLAQIASSKLCIRLEDNRGSHMLEKSRHLSYSMRVGDFGKLKPLGNSKQLRTLLPIDIQGNSFLLLSKRVMNNILPRLTSLRALSLSHYQIKELPNDLFIKLKLLRFLDLSWTYIKKLPDSICVLYNLETLILSHCDYLEELLLHMEKLINLCRLDISSTSRLKMPLHLSKLKSLHMLVGAKFLLSGWRIEDLGELRNLYGSLSILELQNVVDRTEALKANMKEKEHVEKLSLEWSESIANNSQNERDLLDDLYPNPNIKELRITGYRGTKFPNWLSDQSFLKLVELSLSNCKDCDSLPALGQLPSLKFLAIRGMHRITEVAEEFYGILSSKKPFNSLEKLKFADMPEWEKWCVLGKGEFPALEDLSIEDCPKLNEKFPCLKLKRFEVVGSPNAQLFTSQLEGMKQIVELRVSSCRNLTRLLIPTATEKLYIRDCENLEILSVACGTQMAVLNIHNCEKLKSLPEHMHELLLSLKELELFNCPEIESFPEGGLPFNLQVLHIGNCMKLVNGRKEWHLQRLPCLIWLTIFHDGSDEEILANENWELPCSIRCLTICNLKTLSSQLLKSLTSLEYLYASKLPQIQSLLEKGLPSSLCELRLNDLHDLHLLSTKGLQHLAIWDCPNLQSLPESGMPPSISELSIRRCPFLKPLLEFDKGDYWTNISQIPTINIDEEYP